MRWLVGLVCVIGCSLAVASPPEPYAQINPLLPPWGDYGEVLWNGLAHRGVDGNLQISRTGPFVPPIFFPGIGHVVVRDDVKRWLIGSGLTGVSFRPVVVVRAVELRWETWDRKAEMPEEPADGEPENFILKRPHSPQLVEQIGPLWELVLETHVKLTWHGHGHDKPPRPGSKQAKPPLQTQAVDDDAPDFCTSQMGVDAFVSTRARAWLEKNLPNTIHYVTWPTTAALK